MVAMSSDILEGAIWAFVVGGVFFFKGWHDMKQRRLIEETPTSKIRSIAMGLTEIKGRAKQGLQLYTAPFSQKQCVYYKFLVQEYRRSKNHGYWATIKSGGVKDEFLIEDDTGAVALNPVGARIDLPHSFMSKKLGKEGRAALIDLGVKEKGFLGFGRNLRYVEYAIEPDEQLYVLGTAKTKKDASGTKNEDHIVIGNHRSNIFYISNKPEKELLKKFGIKTWLSLFGGAGLLILGVIIVVIRFSV